MTEQELIEKIAIYNQYLKEGNKSPAGVDDYIIMIAVYFIIISSWWAVWKSIFMSVTFYY